MAIPVAAQGQFFSIEMVNGEKLGTVLVVKNAERREVVGGLRRGLARTIVIRVNRVANAPYIDGPAERNGWRVGCR